MDFEIIEGIEQTDFDAVQRWLASSYWVPGIAKDTIVHAAKHSALVINAFTKEKTQIGFGRIVSDKSRFAYLSDFIVDDKFRGKGIAQVMVRFALDHPEFATVSNWCLMTLDAHGLYEKFGFKPITDADCKTERWMARIRRKS